LPHPFLDAAATPAVHLEPTSGSLPMKAALSVS